MIKLLTRKECLGSNSTLAAFIQDVQNKIYSPEANDLLFSPGENYIEELEKWVILSKEECEKRNEPIIQEFEQTRDKIEAPEIGNFNVQKIISSTAENFETHQERTSKGLQALNKELEWEGMLFIPDYPFPWLRDLNSENEISDWFRRIGLSGNFNGGIYANGEDLEIVLKQLMEIIKNIPDYPGVSFTGTNSSAIGSLCKYGNLHYLIYNEEESLSLDQALNNSSLMEIPFGACSYKF